MVLRILPTGLHPAIICVMLGTTAIAVVLLVRETIVSETISIGISAIPRSIVTLGSSLPVSPKHWQLLLPLRCTMTSHQAVPLQMCTGHFCVGHHAKAGLLLLSFAGTTWKATAMLHTSLPGNCVSSKLLRRHGNEANCPHWKTCYC